METALLHDIIIIFGLAVLVLFICHRLRIHSIVGFLLTGILAGPYGIGLVRSVHQVEAIAELGVILLLFSIGLEFSFKSLLKMKKIILLGGSLQVGFTILITYLISRALGLPGNQAVFLGFLISLSSTAIVLKQLGERLEMEAPQGKTALAILIFQDIIVVAMMLFTPLLSTGSIELRTMGIELLKAAGIIGVVIVMSVYMIPPILYQITRTQNREIFLLSIIVICFSIAWVTSGVGLSLALGAFLAGLIIAESEYSHQALANIIPFMDTFTSLFFVSIGMLLNLHIAAANIGMLVVFTLGILLVKGFVSLTAGIIMGYPLRVSILVGFSLCQVGEFSFILAQSGIDSGLLNDTLYQGFLAASILTMMAAPFLISLAPRAAEAVSKIPLPVRLQSGIYPWTANIESRIKKRDHLVIIGYGVNGRNLSRAALYAGIPYAILEMNAETVREEKEKGQPIYFGDATHEEVLKQVKIQDARVVVIAISDPAAIRRITFMARKLNPSTHIIVRTRLVADMPDLQKLGSDVVIPEEYETSVEIFARVLDRYMVPRDKIEEFISMVRSENYEMLRSVYLPGREINILKKSLSDIEVGKLRVSKESKLAGKTLAEADFRNQHGATVLAINRGEQYIPNPGAENIIKEDDCLIVIGRPEEIRSAVRMIKND